MPLRSLRICGSASQAWIGSNVSVLKGVAVADGCVVASGSVLTRSYPAGCLIGGNPARVLKENIRWGEDAVEMPAETAGAPSPARHLASEGHERNVNATSA
jgi:serine acetyltransferase